jgi:N-acetylmuramic acid 6-phosphate etherase
MSPRQIVRLMNEEEAVVLRALQAAEEGIAIAIERAAQAFQSGGRVLYIGSGTSGRLALLDAAEMPPTFGLESDRFVALLSGGFGATKNAVEDAEDDAHAAIDSLNHLNLARNDIVIGIAASGTTPFVVGGIRHAKQKGVWTCGIANNKKAPLLEVADHAIFLDTGPEVLTGSTRLKAGTAQKLVLNRISTGAMVCSGKVVENLMIDVKAKNQKLRERCVRILCELAPITQDEARHLLEESDWSVRQALESTKTEAIRS